MKGSTGNLKRCGKNLAAKCFTGVVLFVMFLGATAMSYGQIAQQLVGRVTDATGAVVPNAMITVTNEATAVAISLRSTQSGDWVAPYLQPGRYTVKIEKAGFETETVAAVSLDVGQLRSVDARLKVGSTKESVTVRASELAIQTENADEEGLISGQLINDLPYNGRNVMTSSITVAGAGSKNGLNNQSPYGNITSGIVFNSSAGSLNIDGVNNMSTGFQTMAYVPLVDAVQQIVVDMTPYDAGAVGFATAGNIDVHLKSGTNKLHGTVYEYYKSTGLDANTWVNNYNGRARSSHKSNQYGFEADGPVVIPHFYNGHDKTFFTSAFEIYDQTTPAPVTTSVPGVMGQSSWLTPQGGFYEFNGLTQSGGAPVTLYDPATVGGCAPLVHGGWTPPAGVKCTAALRESFQQEGAPNSYSIPVGRVNQAALNILKYFPAPNVLPASGSPWQNNYFVPVSIPSRYTNFMIKIDHLIGTNDQVSARWGRWDQFQTSNTNGFPTGNPAEYGGIPNGQRFQNPAGEWIHTFSANAIFDLKVSVDMDESENKASLPFNSSTLGLPDVSAGVTQPSLLGVFPQINLNNVSGGNFAQMGATGTSLGIHNELNILPSVNLVHGAHDIHIGLDNREFQISTKQGSGGLTLNSSANWTQEFNNVTSDVSTGSSIASFMLDSGYLSGGSLTQPAQSFETYHYWGTFLQDNYKANKKLTLNLGLRYDFPSQAVERHNRYTNYFDGSAVSPIAAAAQANGFNGDVTGGLTFSGVNGVPRTQLPRAWYMLEPRGGLSYSLNTKTVIHGGIGMAYNWGAYTGAQTGFSATTSVTPSLSTNYTTPYSTLANPFPGGYVSEPGASLGMTAGLGTGVSFYNHYTKFGATWSYSLGVQRQLTSGDVLDIAYVGKQFTHGPTGESINTPSPLWFAQCNAETGGNPALCTGNVNNPFKGIAGFSGTSLYTGATVSSGQLLLPYPQFTGVTENGKENLNGLWLNSLQFTETHRFANSLVATATYEYARIMDNNGIFDYSTYSPGAPKNLLRIEDSNDLNHRITFTGTYKLPVGRGRTFLGNSNRIVDAVVGGWNVGTLYLYESGRPWQPQCGGGQNAGLSGGTGCLEFPFGTAPLKVGRTNGTSLGSNVIRGAVPCVADRNPATGAIVPRAGATAYGCTQSDWVYKTQFAPATNLVSTGIRLGANSEFDSNLSKSFDTFESYKLIFKIDAFNVTNHAVWNNGYQTSNDVYFGTIRKGITAPANNPRQVQLSATMRW